MENTAPSSVLYTLRVINRVLPVHAASYTAIHLTAKGLSPRNVAAKISPETEYRAIAAASVYPLALWSINGKFCCTGRTGIPKVLTLSTRAGRMLGKSSSRGAMKQVITLTLMSALSPMVHIDVSELKYWWNWPGVVSFHLAGGLPPTT